MTNENGKSDCPVCRCMACCKWIPVSAAITPEGKDYVGYFCGTECYERWLSQKQNNPPGNPENKDK